MKPAPSDWPRFSSTVYYQDQAKAIDWLCRAFGFEIRLKVEGEGGAIVHCELEFGEGLLMIGGEGGWASVADRPFTKSPRSIGDLNTQSLMVHVEDIDAHYATAKAAGALIISEPKVSDYGPEYWSDKGYACVDLEGHVWYFAQRLRNPGES